LFINVSGSFLLGLLFVLLTDRLGASPTTRLALTTGLMGAYTTFPTFSLDTFRLLEDGSTTLALEGFGATSHLRTNRLLELSSDLPVVIEVATRSIASTGSCRCSTRWWATAS
jgi:hypothetical protein